MVHFTFCEKCQLIFASKASVKQCPKCGNTDLYIDVGVEEEMFYEGELCPRCETESLYDVNVAKLEVYPLERRAQAGVVTVSWYCKTCGKTGDYLSDIEVALYPVHLVDMSWEEFLKELLGLPDVALQPNTLTFVYLPDKGGLIRDLTKAKAIISYREDGELDLENFKDFRIDFDEHLHLRTGYGEIQKELLVIDKVTGEPLYQGEKVPKIEELLI